MKRILANKKLMLLLAVAWTVLIFVGCSLPGKDLPAVSLFDHFDKVVHVGFFFIFVLLWVGAIGMEHIQTKHYVLLLVLSFLYGFALEYYQVHFVAGRSWDVWDGVADTVGGGAACLFARKML